MDAQSSISIAPGREPVGRPSREDRFIAAVLAVAAIAPFMRALGFGFVYDDTYIVQHNPALVGWRSLLTLWGHPYWMDAEGAQAGLYRPVHTALLAVIRNAGGGWPLWFHLSALLLHLAATLLVWRMLARGARRWPAALAALWFAVHPVHVEAVANISNSAEQLAAIWTLGLYFVLARASSTREVSWRDALVAAVLFLLAMLSKESGVMALAIALIAAEAWRPPDEPLARAAAGKPGSRHLATLWRRWHRVAIAAVGALSIVAFARAMVLGNALDSASMAAVGIEHMSFGERVWTMLSLGPLVLRLLVWPRAHNPYYGPSSFPTGTRATVAVAATVVVIVVAIVAAVRLVRRAMDPPARDSRPLAAIAWTLLAFLPASNLFFATGQILAERTLYVPSIGIAMLLAWGLEQLAHGVARGRATWRVRPELSRAALVLGAAGTILVCARFAVVAREGTAAWRSHRALIDQMIAADPGDYRGHYLLAIELRRSNATDSIAREFATAYTLYSRDPQLDLDYARFLLGHQQPAAAVQVTRTLMSDSRMRSDAGAIAVYLEARGRAYGADSVLVEASRLFRVEPNPTSALYLGLAHEARSERGAALNAYHAGLRVAPRDSALTARVAALR